MKTKDLIEQLSYHHEGIHGCHQELHELIPVIIHQLKAGQKSQLKKQRLITNVYAGEFGTTNRVELITQIKDL